MFHAIISNAAVSEKPLHIVRPIYPTLNTWYCLCVAREVIWWVTDRPDRQTHTTTITSGNVLASGSDPTWDLPAMFGLYNVPSAHSFPFVKQDKSTCRRYILRTVYFQNSEQVSRTVYIYLPYAFRSSVVGPPGSWHAAVLARAILAYFQVAPSNHEDWEEVQRRPVAEACSACHRGEFFRRLEHFARQRAWKCVKYLEMISGKKKRETKPRMGATHGRRTGLCIALHKYLQSVTFCMIVCSIFSHAISSSSILVRTVFFLILPIMFTLLPVIFCSWIWSL